MAGFSPMLPGGGIDPMFMARQVLTVQQATRAATGAAAPVAQAAGSAGTAAASMGYRLITGLAGVIGMGAVGFLAYQLLKSATGE